MKTETVARCSIGLLLALCAMSAQSAVVYTFTSGPLIATHDGGTGSVTTFSGATGDFSASLSFASALPASSTIAIDAELGGLDLFSPPPAGNVLGFSANAGIFVFPGITSNISDYTVGTGVDTIFVNRYSIVDGSVTTDAAGNIAAWDLDFVLFVAQNSLGVIGSNGTICTGPSCNGGTGDSDVGAGQQERGLSIRSGAPESLNINYTSLNGGPDAGTLPISFVDEAFAGTTTFERSYSGPDAGTWTLTGTPVPLPNTLLLMLVPGLVLAGRLSRRG